MSQNDASESVEKLQEKINANGSRVLSEEEFRQIYLLRKQAALLLAEEMKARAGPAREEAPAAPAPPPVVRPQPFRPMLGILRRLIGTLIQIGLVCLLMCQGDRSMFWMLFSIFAGLKAAAWLISLVSVKVQVPSAPVAPAPLHGEPQRAGRHDRWKVRGKRATKCVTAFFVSAFPSWRVEHLHAELVADGLDPDFPR